MANSRAGNVIRIDETDTTLAGIHDICDIMYQGSGVEIREGSASGPLVWESDMSMCCQAKIRVTGGLHITLTDGVLYLYGTVRP